MCVAGTFLLLAFFFLATSCVDPQQFMVAKFSFYQSTVRDEFNRHLSTMLSLGYGFSSVACFIVIAAFGLLQILIEISCPRRAFCLDISWPMSLFFGVLERCPEILLLHSEHEDVYGKDQNKRGSYRFGCSSPSGLPCRAALTEPM